MTLRTTCIKVLVCISILMFLESASLVAFSQENTSNGTISVDGKPLKLVGRGVREFLFVDIYKMAAYSESGNCNTNTIIHKNETKAIRLSMVRKIPSSRMNSTLRSSLIENMENENDEEMKKTINSFLSFLKGDLSQGTFIEIFYIPGTGTILKQNSKRLGVTPGKSFHELLWKSYFGKDTCCSALKATIIESCKED